MKKIFGIILFLIAILIAFSFSNFNQKNEDTEITINKETSEINFFYSQTCPHCADQKEFHKVLLQKYPDLIINSYDIADSKTAPILKKFAKEYNAEKYIGLVPLTFIGESFILGFNTIETTGVDIELALVKSSPGLLSQAEFCDEVQTELCSTELLEEKIAQFENGIENRKIDSSNYTILNQSSKLSLFGLQAEELSLPVLSILLGFFDGFNVCSLGALMLILSLVLVFKDRKKVFLFGGIFLAITGITYAALIFIWFSLFQFLTPFVSLLEIIIGLIGLIGGFIFLKQYFRFKKYGPTCEMSDSKFINDAVKKLQNAFQNQKNIWILILSVIAFAFVVTLIEFPCSAVIPVAFAAILTDVGVGLGAKIFYLILFMIFYLLDELIIFLIGVFTLRIWMGGQKMTVRLTLIQALVFLAIGGFYIGRLIF